MGKRRERRLAAMMAASRRVKLDLFTEPSGEMVGNSLHDEVGGDLDKDHHEVPSSPSSSGGFHQFILKDYVERICLQSIFLVEIWKYCTRLLYAPNIWF